MKIIYAKNIVTKSGKVEHRLCELGELANGYANFLIKKGDVVLDTPENRVKLNAIRQKELDSYCQELHDAQIDEEQLKDKTFVFYGKATPKGTLINSVTKNDICKLLDTPTIDTKMLQTDLIKTFGKHEVVVNRFPGEVKFKIFIEVKEQAVC
jgi:ribosomal protein L9